MPKEPGEKIVDIEHRDNAIGELEAFKVFMDDVEKDRFVDLDKQSSEKGRVDTTFLRINLEQLKQKIDYLDSFDKKNAADLILRAELYLAAHEPKKEE